MDINDADATVDRVFTAIFIFIGLIFLVWGIGTFLYSLDIEMHGVLAIAKVTDVYTPDEGRGRTYIDYTVDNIEYHSVLNTSYWSRGDIIHVYYLPDSPQMVHIGGIDWFAIFGVVAFGLFLIIWPLTPYSKNHPPFIHWHSDRNENL